MSTDIQICNLALARLLTDGFITSLSDTTSSVAKQSALCALLYPMVRDAILQSYRWNFAERRATLTVYGTQDGTPASPTNWGFSYLCPTDCIMPREIVGYRNPTMDQTIPFEFGTEVVTSVSTQMIYTDMEDAELAYTAQITETGVYPPMVVSAIAWALAIELNGPLSKKQDPNMLRASFQLELGRAIALDNAARKPDKPNDSPFVTDFQ